jgi:tRNA A37 threonylcarbamoyladenosine biosynthesis protein TsaE
MVGKKINITSHSVDDTRALGEKIGSLIGRPLTIALIGDLGCGKTALVQGLARGLDVPDRYYITSPTFTLINEYPACRWFILIYTGWKASRILRTSAWTRCCMIGPS